MSCYSRNSGVASVTIPQVKTKARNAVIAILLSLGVHGAGYACLAFLSSSEPAATQSKNDNFFADESTPPPLEITEVALISSSDIASTEAEEEVQQIHTPIKRHRARKPKVAPTEKAITPLVAQPPVKKPLSEKPPLTVPPTTPSTTRGGWGAAIAANSRTVTAWDRLDLVELAPGEDSFAVMIRFDLLRETPWAEATESVLTPMPDYQLFVRSDEAGGIQRITDEFNLLLISTSNPRDVTKTQLAGLLVNPGQQLQSHLHRADSPVQWQEFPAGTIGNRLASARKHRRDERQFSLSKNGWAFLTQPALIPDLLTPENQRSIPQRMQSLSTLREEQESPALIAAVRPVPISPRKLGITAPAPKSIIAYVDVPESGLQVRGQAAFDTADNAKEFHKEVEKRRKKALGDPLLLGLLRGVHAYNAVAKMQFLQKDNLLFFSTALSNSDGRALLTAAAALAKAYYQPKSP